MLRPLFAPKLVHWFQLRVLQDIIDELLTIAIFTMAPRVAVVYVRLRTLFSLKPIWTILGFYDIELVSN